MQAENGRLRSALAQLEVQVMTLTSASEGGGAGGGRVRELEERVAELEGLLESERKARTDAEAEVRFEAAPEKIISVLGVLRQTYASSEPCILMHTMSSVVHDRLFIIWHDVALRVRRRGGCVRLQRPSKKRPKRQM